MLHVVVDTNVLISSLLVRDPHWSDLRRDVVDAALLAISIANGYSLATFDEDLSNRARTFGVAPYW